MSAIVKEWPRYVIASVNTYFTVGLPAQTLYLEGQEITLSGPSWIEVRIQGPKFTEYQKNSWYIDFTINIAITVKKSTNGYLLEDLIGLVSTLFVDFPLKNFQDPQIDTLVSLCCLVLQKDFEVTKFGDRSIDKQGPLRVTDATVQGSYRGEIQNGSN